MKVLLVHPPIIKRATLDLAPPLWALGLATICREEGIDCALYDCNLRLAMQCLSDNDEFYSIVAADILRYSPDLVCFSSMGINSHVCIEIARRLKGLCQEIVTVFGGPHFSSIASKLVERFEDVDAVALGEGEVTFRALLVAMKIRSARIPSGVPGLVSSSQDAASARRSYRPPSFDEIPAPHYGLIDWEHYVTVNPSRTLDIDAGARGCVFSCAYCYAPSHWGRGERRPSVVRFVEEIERAVLLGARRLFFVQDNFLNSPRATCQLCHEIARAKLPITFHCYATLPQLSQPVIAALADAGCSSVYVGIDAVSADNQQRYGKKHFKLIDDMAMRLAACRDHGIATTVALLIDTDDRNIDQTIVVGMEAVKYGARVRFNSLMLYSGTALPTPHTRFTASQEKMQLAFDAPLVVVENQLAAANPAMFPFHSTHRQATIERDFQRAVHVLATLARSYPETLLSLAKAGKAWKTIERLSVSLDWHELHAQPDWHRREMQLDAFSALALDGEPGRSLIDEQLVLSLRSIKPSHIAVGDGASFWLRPWVSRDLNQSAKIRLAVAHSAGVQLTTVQGETATAVREFERLSGPERLSPKLIELIATLGIATREPPTAKEG
jgi:hypothetical protein